MAGFAPIKVVIAGVDKVSGVLGTAGKNLNAFAKGASGVGRGLRTMGGGLAGVGLGAAALTGLTSVPGQILRIEQGLQALGNTGGLTKTQLKGIGSELKVVSRETNQFQESLLEGLTTLVAKGLDPAKAVALLKPIGAAATASQADVNDLANASFTVYNNLKVPIADVTRALDVMAASGKEGSFELKDMAREFPSLTASAKTLGITGVAGVAKLGAALQVASLGAGSTSEAANNLANFMKNLTSRETVGRFKAEGLDLEQFLATASASAKKLGKDFDPIETVVTELDRVTKGNPFLLGRVFNDAQALNFLKAATQNLGEYRRIRDETGKADGVIQGDFNNMMGTTIERWKQFQITLQTTDIKPITKGINLANSALEALNGNSKTASLLVNGITGAIVGGGALFALGQLTMSLKNVAGAVIWISRVMPLVATAIMANPLLALAAALVGIGAVAYMQAKKAQEVVGTEGLRKDSEARQLLDRAGAKTPLADKVAGMHKGFEAGNPFANVQAPPSASQAPTGQERVTVDVTLKGVPPGSKVDTKATKNMELNTNINMGLAFPR